MFSFTTLKWCKHGFGPILNLSSCIYSPFLNLIEDFFSTWKWKVYERGITNEQVTLLQAMDDTCNDIMADQCQAWIRHARRFFPRCLTNESIHCDVDENLWPNSQDMVDGNIEVQ